MMIMKLNSFFNHSITKNSIALGIMQIANFAVPLLILPYLTRTIGVDAFAAVIFTMAVIQLSYVITDYGFSIYATYEISRQRDDVDEVNKLITSIFGAKIILVMIAGIIVYVVSMISDFSKYQNIFLFAYFAVIAQAFQPIWFFQGIERMKNITIYMVITKLLYALQVFLFVNDPQDVKLVILSWAIAQGTGAIIAIIFVYHEGYSLRQPTIASIFIMLKEASHFFWSRIAVAVYTSVNTMILGLVGNTTQVAFYGACDQIYKAGQNATMPINQALYPYMARQQDWGLFYRLVISVVCIIGLGSFFISFFIEDVLSIIFGDKFAMAAPIMIVFLAMVLVNYIAITFGYPAFGALGQPKYANYTVIIGSFVHIFAVSMLYITDNVSAILIACVTLMTESIVMMLRVGWVLYLKNIKYKEYIGV